MTLITDHGCTQVFFFCCCFLRHCDRKILQRTLPFLGNRTVVLLPSWVRWVGAMISVSLIVFPFFGKRIKWKVGKVWMNKGKMFSHSCSVTWEAPLIYLALPGQRRRLGWLSLDILLLLNPKGLPPTSSSHSPCRAGTRPSSSDFESLSQGPAHYRASSLASCDWICHFPFLCLIFPFSPIIARIKHWHYCLSILSYSPKIRFINHPPLLWLQGTHAWSVSLRWWCLWGEPVGWFAL